MNAAAIESFQKQSFMSRAMVAAVVFVGGAMPWAIYAVVDASCRTISPADAKNRLRHPLEATLLVDVRKPDAFKQGHLEGAVNWPFDDVLKTQEPTEVPPELQNRTLLLVCDVGLSSRWAGWHLQRSGVERVYNVRGGIQEWIRSASVEAVKSRPEQALPATIADLLYRTEPPPAEAFDRWQTADGHIEPLPFRVSPVFEQAVAIGTFFGVKLVYTALSLLGVVVLWPMRDTDLSAMRWALIAFFLGENACALNYFAFRETSYLMEYFHSLGMLVCFGFATYAVLEGIDGRLLHLSDPGKRCAALELCGTCIKHARVSCGLRQLFLCLIPALALLALMLPTADWQDESYNTLVLGQPYNYAHLRVYQILENWYCAAAGVTMLVVSFGILAVKGQQGIEGAKIAFAAAIGPLGFGALRMILAGAYHQNRVWYLCWEEMTELLFIATIGCVLWIFRRRLLPFVRP